MREIIVKGPSNLLAGRRDFVDYYIDGSTGTRRHHVAIEREHFERARAAKLRLLDMFTIEEKFAILLDNYQEFEQALLDLSVKHAVLLVADWSERMSEIYLVVRRLLNLLSSTRLYLDQVQHDLSSLYGDPSAQLEAFRSWTSREYDARLGYRAMEALRNYTQHRSLPVTSLSIGWRREPSLTGPRVLTANPKLELAWVKQQGNFKAQVLTELEQQGDEIALKPLVRDFIEGLAVVHHELQGLVQGEVPALESALAEVRERFNAAVSGEAKRISLVAQDGESIVERHDVFDEFFERGRWLARRTSQARGASSVIVSSEAS